MGIWTTKRSCVEEKNEIENNKAKWDIKEGIKEEEWVRK